MLCRLPEGSRSATQFPRKLLLRPLCRPLLGLLRGLLGALLRGLLRSFLRCHQYLLWISVGLLREKPAARQKPAVGLFIGARRCSVAATPPEMRLIRISELSAERAAH